jgi:hypothetical protein
MTTTRANRAAMRNRGVAARLPLPSVNLGYFNLG